MSMRLTILAAAALSCAGCANQSPMQPMALGYHGALSREASTGVPGGRQSRSTAPVPATTAAKPMKQTLGGKVLSAIALERVTGRKPDPRRFNELR